ncbi:MAG: DNA transporter, partial [Desulfotignum sp.]
MQIFQIISPDGYIADLYERDKDSGILSARFHFPLVSDYIRSALREGKPYFFTGRSGNAQIGIKTDLADGAEPVVEESDIYVEGRLQNLNPLLG